MQPIKRFKYVQDPFEFENIEELKIEQHVLLKSISKKHNYATIKYEHNNNPKIDLYPILGLQIQKKTLKVLHSTVQVSQFNRKLKNIIKKK